MTEELINKINELANKKKQHGLTKEEEQEQYELRQEYLKIFRGSMKKQMENVDFLKQLIVNKEDINTLDNLKKDNRIVRIEEKKTQYEITYKMKEISESEIKELLK